MTIKTNRVYLEGSGPDFPEDFQFSIVSDETIAKYVYPKNGEIQGLDDDRIEEIKALIYKNGEPKTSDDWNNIALYGINGSIFDGPEYKSLKEAISSETLELDKSKELSDDLNNEDQEESDDYSLIIDDSEGEK